VLVVSHDRYFLDRICDRVLVFEDHGNVHLQEGNYSYYLEKNRDRLAVERAAASAFARDAGAVSAKPAAVREKARRLSYKEERELESMEFRIMELEQAISELENQINDPAFYISRAAEAPGLVAGIASKKETLQDMYVRWEELEAIKAGQANA
jgi:ATP-binding cassette subfamily F protein uup